MACLTLRYNFELCAENSKELRPLHLFPSCVHHRNTLPYHATIDFFFDIFPDPRSVKGGAGLCIVMSTISSCSSCWHQQRIIAVQTPQFHSPVPARSQRSSTACQYRLFLDFLVVTSVI